MRADSKSAKKLGGYTRNAAAAAYPTRVPIKLMGRMDARLFASTLVDDAGEVAKKAVNELRRELDKRVESMSTQLDRSERESKNASLTPGAPR